MPYVTIEVLQEDIERARRDRRYRARPATFCPIARAVCRALSLALGHVKVGGNSLSIWGWKDHDYLRAAATKKLEHAVTWFDRDKQMQPDRFRINLTPSPGQGGEAHATTSRHLRARRRRAGSGERHRRRPDQAHQL